MSRKKHDRQQGEKMRISFDLDEVLFVNPSTHKCEPRLRFPLRLFYKERLRLGTPELINELQKMGYDIWVYTSSYRTEFYIKSLFFWYGVKFNGIVNAMRHEKEVQSRSKSILPQKMPSFYRISLHIDDESVICSYGRKYGYDVFQLFADDDSWKEKVIAKAKEVKKKWEQRH